MICHIIHNTLVDELIEVIESDNPQVDLQYVVSSGLAESHSVSQTIQGRSGRPIYELSSAGKQLKAAWKKYGKI